MSINARRRTDSNGVSQIEIATPPPPMAAPSSSSFFQTSLQIIDRLSCIPGFDYYLDPEYLAMIADSDIPTIDPVTTLWSIFRIGNALCELVNIGRPQNPVAINNDNSMSNLNLCKKSVFHFLVACKNDFGIRSEDVFAISELYQQDTNGFVKVLRTVSLVLDYLENNGLVDTTNPQPHRFSDLSGSAAPKDNRAKVVRELLETERSYIRDLEMLQNYHRAVQRDGKLSPDNMLYLFANLNELVDFQRKFLIGVEANAIHAPEDQHFGDLFLQMEESFAVYEPFCANYERASKIVEEQVGILMNYAQIMEPQRQLLSYLIKPIQRICKYPLLLQELIKSSDKDMPNYPEMQEGLASIKRVADRVNETRRNVENQMIVKDLEKRVKGWHDHAAQSFGELLLHDKFVMSSNEVEKELMVYLFENIMICCKEVNSKKNKKKTPSLQLKGRIFISSITGVVNYSRNGIYALKVLWRDAQMGNFSLRCRNDEQLRMWYTTLERLINEPAEPVVEERRPSVEALQAHRQQAPVANNSRLRSAPGGLSGEQLSAHNAYYGGARKKVVDDDAMSFIATSDDEEEEVDDEHNGDRAGNWENGRRAGTLSMNGPPGAHRNRPVNHRQNGHQSMPVPTRRGPHEYSQQPVPNMPGNNSDMSDQEHSPVERVRQTPDWYNSQNRGVPARQVGSNSNSNYLSGGSGIPIPQRHPSASHALSPHPVAHGANGQRLETGIPSPRRRTSPNLYANGRIPTSADRPVMTHAASANGTGQRYPMANRTPSSASAPLRPGGNYVAAADQVKIKVNYMDDVYVISVSNNVSYRELLSKLEKKIRICGGEIPNGAESLKIQYFDEDGDRVTIKNDEDVQTSFESRESTNTNAVLNFFVS